MLRQVTILAALVIPSIVVTSAAQPDNYNSLEARSRASARLLAGKVASDLRNVAHHAARMGGPLAGELRQRCDQSVTQAAQLQQTLASAMPQQVVEAQFRTLDRGIDDLVRVARRQAGGDVTLVTLATQADATCGQLGASLAFGGWQPGGNVPVWNDPQRQTLVRLARSLDGQAETLLSVARATLPQDLVGQSLEGAIRQFARSADRVKDALEANAPVERAGEMFGDLHAKWSSAGQVLGGIGLNGYPQLRMQAAQVDRSVKTMAAAFGLNPLPNPVPRPGPAPGPGPWFPINNNRDQGVIAVGAGEGGVPVVRVYLDRTGQTFHDFMAYDENFQGGVRVALGDANGDGVVDVITAPGPGSQPLIRVFDGRDYSLISQFLAYDPRMPSGVWVAAADIAGAGRVQVVTGGGNGAGPHVRAFDALTGQVQGEFFAYDQRLSCGARVAVGDVDGDGVPDIVTSPGPGVAPLVRVFNGRGLGQMSQFLAYEEAFQGGCFVAAACVDADGRAEVATGAGTNGGPHVRLFKPLTGQVIGEYFAYDRNFLGGVRVALFDVDRSRRAAVVTAPGPGMQTLLRVTRVIDGRLNAEFTAFDPRFASGGFVAAN